MILTPNLMDWLKLRLRWDNNWTTRNDSSWNWLHMTRTSTLNATQRLLNKKIISFPWSWYLSCSWTAFESTTQSYWFVMKCPDFNGSVYNYFFSKWPYAFRIHFADDVITPQWSNTALTNFALTGTVHLWNNVQFAHIGLTIDDNTKTVNTYLNWKLSWTWSYTWTLNLWTWSNFILWNELSAWGREFTWSLTEFTYHNRVLWPTEWQQLYYQTWWLQTL